MRKVKKDIIAHLRANGDSKVGELANATGYSASYIRTMAKELMADGHITGRKGKVIPAYIINGDYVVAGSDRKHLLDIVRRYASGLLSTAKGMSVKQLQKLIRDRLADQTVGGPRPWIFSI